MQPNQQIILPQKPASSSDHTKAGELSPTCERFGNTELMMLIASSDAMAPLINIGDQVLFDPSVRRFTSEGIYLLHCNGALVLRRVSLGNQCWLISTDNPAYGGPSSVSPMEAATLEIVGRVKWIGVRV